jgi:hypothetical protein
VLIDTDDSLGDGVFIVLYCSKPSDRSGLARGPLVSMLFIIIFIATCLVQDDREGENLSCHLVIAGAVGQTTGGPLPRMVPLSLDRVLLSLD